MRGFTVVNEFMDDFEKIRIILNPKAEEKSSTIFKKTVFYEGLQYADKQKSVALLV